MSKAVNFPSISPSSRAYNPGVFPQTEFAANNGAVSVVRFGNQRVDSELQLVFENITDSQTAAILENYEAVNSGWDFVQFNSGTASVGVRDDDLRDFFRESGTGLHWRYREPPQVRSSFPNRQTVTCTFRGYWDGN